jgi:hypothetical protein
MAKARAVTKRQFGNSNGNGNGNNGETMAMRVTTMMATRATMVVLGILLREGGW